MKHEGMSYTNLLRYMDRKRQRLNLTPKPLANHSPTTSPLFYSLSIFLPSITPKPNPQFSFSLSISLYISSLITYNHIQYKPIF